MSSLSLIESWRKVFGDAVAPVLNVRGLSVLADALEKDDPALIQSATTLPAPLQAADRLPCEGACLLAYAGWRGKGLKTVGEVECYFACVCQEVDEILGEPAGCRWFLNWFDDTPREQMRQELLAEVKLALADLTAGPSGLPAA
jgi:hypothetical protein